MLKQRDEETVEKLVRKLAPEHKSVDYCCRSVPRADLLNRVPKEDPFSIENDD